MKKSRLDSNRVYLLVGVLLSAVGGVIQGSPSDAELRKITLQETLNRFTEENYLLKRYRMRWKATDADIEQLLNRDGWILEMGGRKEVVGGNRLETRNSSLGRSPRRDYDRVTEREDYLRLGIRNSFLEETRRKKADAIQEEIKRLDDIGKFDLLFREATLNAALAFTGAYYRQKELEWVREERTILEENLRIVQARLEVEEALTLDLLEEKAELAEIRKKQTALELGVKKRIDFLRDLWGYPDLEAEMLAKPDLPETTDLANFTLREVIAKALAQRDDIESSLRARRSFLGSSEYNRVLPEVELSLSSRYGHFDRDFADEGRHDTTYDLRLDLEVSIPLSLRRRNEARDRRFRFEFKEREYEVLEKQEAIRNEVREAFEDYLLAREEIRVRKLVLDQEREKERMTRVTLETLPEVLKGDPARKWSQVRRSRIRAEIDYLHAVQDCLENTLILMSLMGELSPDYRSVLAGRTSLE